MNNYNYPTTYPLNLSDEQSFEISQFPFLEQPMFQQDYLFQSLPASSSNQYCDPPMQLDTDPPIDHLTSINIPNNINDHGSCSALEKKTVHKDVERRRRKEMNALYASLRSLLPLECLRGKRAISDHMNEATHYIKHLEKKIQALGNKREMLKRTISFNARTEENLGTNASVTVRKCWPGIEIVINSSRGSKGLPPLSRVLETLVGEGFDVVNCIANKVNNTSVYTLQCEVNNLGIISQNMSALQNKLMTLVQLESSWTGLKFNPTFV